MVGLSRHPKTDPPVKFPVPPVCVLGSADNLSSSCFVRASDLYLVWSWFLRYIHIALDTLVLYGVLRERGIDERADGERSSTPAIPSGASSAGPHKSVAPHV